MTTQQVSTPYATPESMANTKPSTKKEKKEPHSFGVWIVHPSTRGPACSSMSVTQHNTQLLMIHGPSQSNFCHWYKFTEHRVHQPAHQLHFHLMSPKSPAPSRGCAVSREAVGQTSNGLMHRPLPCPSPCFVVSLINKYFPIAFVFLVALESHGDCWAFFSFFVYPFNSRCRASLTT